MSSVAIVQLSLRLSSHASDPPSFSTLAFCCIKLVELLSEHHCFGNFDISPVRVIFFTAKRHHRVIPAIGEVTRISGISVSHSEAAYTNSDKMQTTAFRVILITPMLFICTLSRGHSMGRDFLWCLRKSKNIEFLDYLLVISSSNC